MEYAKNKEIIKEERRFHKMSRGNRYYTRVVVNNKKVRSYGHDRRWYYDMIDGYRSGKFTIKSFVENVTGRRIDEFINEFYDQVCLRMIRIKIYGSKAYQKRMVESIFQITFDKIYEHGECIWKERESSLPNMAELSLPFQKVDRKKYFPITTIGCLIPHFEEDSYTRIHLFSTFDERLNTASFYSIIAVNDTLSTYWKAYEEMYAASSIEPSLLKILFTPSSVFSLYCLETNPWQMYLSYMYGSKDP